MNTIANPDTAHATHAGRACHVCAASRSICCSPPPDVANQWGYIEHLALGDYWLHVSAVDRTRQSYGSALDAYTRAERTAATPEEREAAYLGMIDATRMILNETRWGREHLGEVPAPWCACLVCEDTRRRVAAA